MSAGNGVFLFFAAILGGALNAVAGGGSFISFPSLIFTGVPPVQANATNTVALWTGLTASGGAFRRRLTAPRRLILPLIATSITGGLAGAFLLLKTPQRTFLHLIPWLMLGATVLFIFGDRLRHLGGSRDPDASDIYSWQAITVVAVVELLVSTYGGYFGGGMGILHLGVLAALGLRDIHAMNAIKTVLGSLINGVAVVAFVVAHAVFWPQALVMIVGALIGGWFGAHYSMKVAPRRVRLFVIAIGLAMSAYFFVKTI